MATVHTKTLLLLAAALIAGCDAVIVGPGSSLEGLPPGLRVELDVDPGVVAPHAPFTARLSVTNTTTRELRVVTAHGCLAIPYVMRDQTRLPFEGSWWGCTAAITTHAFAPGETRTRIWEMRAELYAAHPGDRDGAPASPGVYRVGAEFDTYSPSGPTSKPSIERSLLVR